MSTYMNAHSYIILPFYIYILYITSSLLRFGKNWEQEELLGTQVTEELSHCF